MAENEQNVVNTVENNTGFNMNEQILGEIKVLAKKQVRWQRLMSLFVIGVFGVLLAIALILVPRVQKTLTEIDDAIAQIESSIEEVDTMVAEMTDASKNLNKLVNDNSAVLTETVNNMSNIDFEGLNKAIKDLQDTVGPFASFFGKFR